MCSISNKSSGFNVALRIGIDKLKEPNGVDECKQNDESITDKGIKWTLCIVIQFEYFDNF